MSADEVAKAFVQHFYQAFDSNVDSLASLYVSPMEIWHDMAVQGQLGIGCLPSTRSCTFLYGLENEADTSVKSTPVSG
jgi:hypothetical protein